MKIYYIPLAILCTLPFAANASEKLSYSYIEVDYINLDIDRVGDNGNILDDFDNGGGYALRGSIEFSPNWFAFAGFSKTDADSTFLDDQNMLIPANTDIERLNAGIGYFHELSSQTDLVLSAAYSDVDLGNFNFGATDSSSLDDLNEDSSDGFYADARLRSQ